MEIITSNKFFNTLKSITNINKMSSNIYIKSQNIILECKMTHLEYCIIIYPKINLTTIIICRKQVGYFDPSLKKLSNYWTRIIDAIKNVKLVKIIQITFSLIPY